MGVLFCQQERRTPSPNSVLDRAWHFKEYVHCVVARAGSAAESETHVHCRIPLVGTVCTMQSDSFGQNLVGCVHHRDSKVSNRPSLAGRANRTCCYDRLSQGKVDTAPTRDYTLSNQMSHLASQAVMSLGFEQAAIKLGPPLPEGMHSQSRHFVGIGARACAYDRLLYENTQSRCP
jgi:hypothetical protein